MNFQEFWAQVPDDGKQKFMDLAGDEGLPGIEKAYNEGKLTYHSCTMITSDDRVRRCDLHGNVWEEG